MITRRQALATGLVVAVRPPAALAADTDAAPLAALAAYQREVVEQYNALLQKTSGTEHRTLEHLRGRAAAASAALPKAAAVPAPADATLETLIAAEEALVAGCYAALQTLTDERHLKGCAAFMADAGRRLVVLRDLAGKPLVPRAFETGVS
jgi:hypothetical protein